MCLGNLSVLLCLGSVSKTARVGCFAPSRYERSSTRMFVSCLVEWKDSCESRASYGFVMGLDSRHHEVSRAMLLAFRKHVSSFSEIYKTAFPKTEFAVASLWV